MSLVTRSVNRVGSGVAGSSEITVASFQVWAWGAVEKSYPLLLASSVVQSLYIRSNSHLMTMALRNDNGQILWSTSILVCGWKKFQLGVLTTCNLKSQHARLFE